MFLPKVASVKCCGVGLLIREIAAPFEICPAGQAARRFIYRSFKVINYPELKVQLIADIKPIRGTFLNPHHTSLKLILINCLLSSLVPLEESNGPVLLLNV